MGKTVVSFYEVPEGRNVIANFQLVYSDGGKEITRSKPHTISLGVDCDPVVELAGVNTYLQTHPNFLWPAIPESELNRAYALCAAEHTPEVKAAFEIWKKSLAEKQ